MPKVSEKPKTWKKSKIKIDWEGRKVEVHASVNGNVAVHRPNEKWSVTSLSTGYCLARVKNQDDAFLIAQVLSENCADELKAKDKTKLVKDLPDWAKVWLQSCSKRSRFVNPKF